VSPFDQEQLRARRFGFAALSAWASAGLCLEAAHAFKLAAYLDHPLRRELLVWGHAHGVGLALVVLAYAALGNAGEPGLRFGRRLRLAAVLMPLGFVLAIFGHGESDPGPAIWLVPPAALLLLSALFGITRSLRA
jgi:hypothetical protein